MRGVALMVGAGTIAGSWTGSAWWLPAMAALGLLGVALWRGNGHITMAAALLTGLTPGMMVWERDWVEVGVDWERVRGVAVEKVKWRDGQRLKLRVKEVVDGKGMVWKGDCLVMVYGQGGVEEGDMVTAQGMMEAVPKASRTGYRGWLRREGVSGVMWRARVEALRGADSVRMAEGLSARERLERGAAVWRTKLAQRYESLGLNDRERGVAGAMTLGNRSGIGSEVRLDYAAAGGSHVLAISGLHLSVVTMVWLWLLRGRAKRGRRRWVVGGVVVAWIWGFALLVGARVSVVRSAVMLTMVTVGTMGRREGDSMNALALAALGLIAADGGAVRDVGFQLSFLSVWAILMGRDYLKAADEMKPKWMGRVMGTLLVSLLAGTATLGLTAYYFGMVAAYFAVGGAWGAMMTPPVMVTAMAYLSGLAPGEGLVRTVRLMDKGMEWIGGLPWAVTEVNVGWPEVALFYGLIAGAWIMAARWWRKRGRRNEQRKVWGKGEEE